MFFQAFVLVLPFAFERPWPPAVRLAAVWLAVTVLPNLSGHEPRYYVSALLPLGILGAVGIQGWTRRLGARSRPRAWAATLAVLVLLDRSFLFPLMPYEVEQDDLEEVRGAVAAIGAGGTVLLPWVTDYCFLRFVYPHLSVRLAMSATPGGRYRHATSAGPIAPGDQAWAGRDRYAGGMGALARAPQPWLYVGWSYNPVMLRIQALLEAVGLEARGNVGGTGWHDHLAESWMWNDPRLSKLRVWRRGQYEVYRVSPLRQSSASRPATTSAAPNSASMSQACRLNPAIASYAVSPTTSGPLRPTTAIAAGDTASAAPRG